MCFQYHIVKVPEDGILCHQDGILIPRPPLSLLPHTRPKGLTVSKMSFWLKVKEKSNS